jgi:hypothetical protein
LAPNERQSSRVDFTAPFPSLILCPAEPRNRTGFPRNRTGLKPPDVGGPEYFRPANRTKMFHVKHIGTIAREYRTVKSALQAGNENSMYLTACRPPPRPSHF